MKTRQILGDVLIFAAVLFTIYLSVIMIHRIRTVVLKDTYISIFRYELLACAIFLLFAFDLRFGFLTAMSFKALKIVGWLVRILVVLAFSVILFFVGKVTLGSFVRTAEPVEHVLVLGLALENGKPTADLISRLDTAERYWRADPESSLVLTGGNPDPSGRTEAGVMRDILLERGIPEEALILEDLAASTKDNFRNAARLIDPDEPVVLISSNYHMDRAVRTAKGAGFTHVLRLPAPSSVLNFGANVMWEVVLEMNSWLHRR
ncbi:MAG: YdcF family protein [Oscillospiraceae bacterium]|nr:YdcF family protein [Oscillospiraceae bacterium]